MNITQNRERRGRISRKRNNLEIMAADRWDKFYKLIRFARKRQRD